MLRRRPTNPRKDKRIFTRTAATTKAVNLAQTTYRGGIRF